MRRYWLGLVVLGLFLGLAANARADDRADALAIIEKGIKAVGGEEKLAKAKNAVGKAKITIHTMGIMLEGEMTVSHKAPDKFRNEIDLTFMGQNINVINVINGDKGWTSMMGNSREMTEEELAEAKRQMYAQAVAGLLVLRDKKYELSTLGESKVENKPALGVRVASKDQKDISLFFDKGTGLLVKTEGRVKDMAGQETNQETFASDYKDVSGLKLPSKSKILRDGNPFIEVESTEHRIDEKLDDSLFEKP